MKKKWYILNEKNIIIPASLYEFNQWCIGNQMQDRRIIGQYTNRQGVKISTTFLGLDHSVSSYATVPVLFETLVIGGSMHGRLSRTHTYKEAVDTHNLTVSMLAKDIFDYKPIEI